ncbi:autotransporter outer membrane beta-barrel domain-containing protein [Bartonella sp. AC90GZZY]|uniref:autotransporter outer membrane beta-barrel domain-containing protein n=1 Tax=Bartonella sp. AC90GZZY TaxID=3243461 RepID=UPI0035CEF253
MRRNLLLCTAACALFFSSFTFTSTSTASGLSPEERYALEEIIKLPQQYRHAIDLINTPTQAEKNLEKIASGATMEDNSHFNQALQNSMDDVRDRINSTFAGAGGYGSGAHTKVLAREMDNIRAQAMANKRHKDMQIMMQANVQLDQLRQNRLIKAENLLRGYNKAVSDAAKAAKILDADNQRRINAARQQWTTQNNRDWYELQNTAEILHKAAQVDNALQGQNKELSDTLRKAVLETLNADGMTNMERKEETSPPPTDTSFTRTGHGITRTTINENSQPNLDSKTNTTPSVSKTTLNTPTEAHAKLLSKDDNTATADTQSISKLTADKATSTSLDGTEKRTTLTAQVESSLTMPIAMFAVGVSDVNNQNILLDNMQITMFEPKDHQERGIFLSTYGNKSAFSSKSPTKQDGVQADIRYAALQAGATLIALEDQNISTNFGFFGTYGKLSFAPKNKESSLKKMLDKWSLTAYGNIQHDSGIYASAFLSYGMFKDNITADNIKHALKVNDRKTLGAAATVGQKLSTSFEGVILEPQVQLVYQRLLLGSFSDEDNSKMNIRKPDQWLLRIGGRLTQNKGHAVSFYSRLNMTKTFSKSFPLAAMGSLIEGGVGIHAHLSQNIQLHSDLSYQHKFKKVGISGISISCGMRYHF